MQKLLPIYLFYAALAIFSILAVTFDRYHAVLGYATDHYNGTLWKPVVWRILSPAIAHIVNYLTPEMIRNSVTAYFFNSGPTGISYSDVTYGCTPCTYPSAVMLVVMSISLFVYGVVLHKLYQKFFPENQCMAIPVAFLGILVLINFDYQLKLYDYSVVALAALCLLYLHEQKWRNYLLCFGLACINKETAFFEIVLFSLVYGTRLKEKKIRTLLLIQILLYIIIVGTIVYIFHMNPGANFYIRLNPFFKTLYSYFYDDVHNATHVIVLIMLCHFIARRWHDIPYILRQSLWLVLLNVGLYYLTCAHAEYRDFIEVFPYLTLMAGHGIFYLYSPENKKI